MPINIWGLAIVVIMLIPNMIYAHKNRQAENKCTNRLMNIIEQVGRYGSMFLMAFNIGIAEAGFSSDQTFAVWIVSEAILLLLYGCFWWFYFKTPTKTYALLLAIIPSVIFILTGVLSRHWLLVILGATFSVGHIYVTTKNH